MEFLLRNFTIDDVHTTGIANNWRNWWKNVLHINLYPYESSFPNIVVSTELNKNGLEEGSFHIVQNFGCVSDEDPENPYGVKLETSETQKSLINAKNGIHYNLTEISKNPFNKFTLIADAVNSKMAFFIKGRDNEKSEI